MEIRTPAEVWNERYTEPFASYGTEPNDYLHEVAERIPAGPVLCLAEGEGRNAVYLAARGHSVTAVDLSEVGLANARKLAARHGVTVDTVVADLTTYDFGDSHWSGIISIWAHMPSAARPALHAACARALRPGGVFVLEAYTPRHLHRPGVGGPPVVDALPTPAELRRDLAGLQLEHCREVDREITEGKYHHGPSTTVQVLAFKPPAGAAGQDSRDDRRY
ncbi:SAM-dependent methyltransferase [Nocardia flavorosea]|uniref:Class I SAM-dependent methyltransferase n=1 Tax=Nocardia flavorosea TaxID=53429 RepID=A0A846YT04_9NOCA|nr:class I SAM-dependent methyltransferase [Nocardia flavorosea]NKY60109.1 class I SAM-dependent methyltransferase [Nocardia flavorosea]